MVYNIAFYVDRLEKYFSLAFGRTRDTSIKDANVYFSDNTALRKSDLLPTFTDSVLI